MYHGSAEDRAECRATEWWFDDGVLEAALDKGSTGTGTGRDGGGRGGGGRGKKKGLLPKFQVGFVSGCWRLLCGALPAMFLIFPSLLDCRWQH